MAKSKLKISIESKSGNIDTPHTTGRALSYLDMNSSADTISQSIMALAESKETQLTVCNNILATVKQIFLSNFFSNDDSATNELEVMHSKITTLFTEVNSKLVAMRHQESFTEASLAVGILNGNTLYIGSSGNINTLLLRGSILYNLQLKDSVFIPIKTDSYKNRTKNILMGTTIIPQIDTYKLEIKEGDILLFVSSGISENIDDKEILLTLDLGENKDESLDRLINTVVGRNPGKNVALISLNSIKQSADSEKKYTSGRILAELPPEFPPGMFPDDIELKRSRDDYYNTSKLSKEIPKEYTPEIHTYEELKPAAPPKPMSAKAKIALFFISFFLTVAAGVFWMLNSGELETPFQTNWELRTEIPISNVRWQKEQMPLKGNVLTFEYRSDKAAEFEIYPDDVFYDCEISVHTSSPSVMQSSQSASSVKKNTIKLEKDKITINTNLCTTAEPVKIAESSKDADGKTFYSTIFKISKIKGTMLISSSPMRNLREINIELKKHIE